VAPADSDVAAPFIAMPDLVEKFISSWWKQWRKGHGPKAPLDRFRIRHSWFALPHSLPRSAMPNYR
jgi:hypothetical protein